MRARLVGQSPHGGWFAYVPYTERAVLARARTWTSTRLALLFLTISTTVGAINFIVTILTVRAPGMTIGRMPLFLFSTLTVSFSIIFSLPALTAACIVSSSSIGSGARTSSTSTHGGSALLWQQLFWFFGHPWVYIIFLPATGMISMIMPVFARRPIVGYTLRRDGDGAHRRRRLRRLGASHVRDRQLTPHVDELLQRREHDDLDLQRRPGVRVDRDDLAAAGRCSRRRCCSPPGSSPVSSSAA